MIRASVASCGIAAALVLLGAQSAQALEAFKAYDTFTATAINPTLWYYDGEETRAIKGGQLNLMQRSWSSVFSNSDTTSRQFDQRFLYPLEITEIRAKVTVASLEVNACAGNPAVSQTRARIIEGLFNSATPVPGSENNDVLAQVRLTRFSNSSDPAGVLQVQGVLTLCTNDQCSNSTVIGSIVNLGTVAVGTPATVQFQWDKPSKTVFFSRDNGAFAGSVTYTQSDVNSPGDPYAALSTRTDIANCMSAVPVGGSVSAFFDNVAVNRSAAP